MSDESSALAQGFYWYAVKLMWGYEGITRNPGEAFRFYRQAADLGFTDAMIRMGELLEHGKGVAQDSDEALLQYQKAANAGTFLGWGFVARLLSRAEDYPRAERYWGQFFQALNEQPDDPRFFADSAAGMIHMYLEVQLARDVAPDHIAVICHYRLPLIAHHQHLLEHASDERLDLLSAVADWMSANLDKR